MSLRFRIGGQKGIRIGEIPAQQGGADPPREPGTRSGARSAGVSRWFFGPRRTSSGPFPGPSTGVWIPAGRPARRPATPPSGPRTPPRPGHLHPGWPIEASPAGALSWSLGARNGRAAVRRPATRRPRPGRPRPIRDVPGLAIAPDDGGRWYSGIPKTVRPAPTAEAATAIGSGRPRAGGGRLGGDHRRVAPERGRITRRVPRAGPVARPRPRETRQGLPEGLWYTIILSFRFVVV